ncbi:helical backbone metal receptor [Ramlibacter sp. H39-3-26]|uniref:ABC transporter substrate-binding protein n=1 Tax=Curvibacter soli TaxID=3031331 RepID=UPI0023DB53D2|nr:helical backbone metal receptor [Ramlibacter sp. H39-3-26]MDF1485328.1 helical backbone metal receptor [Ramlibacter sp. H39-3-26]
MMRRRCLLLRLFLAALLAPLAAQAGDVTDDRGRTVHFAQPPVRIVSLLPSLTETVCALGQCQRLVGVDRYSNWPDAVRKLPQVGGGLDPSIESIVALKPDAVLLSVSSRASERLEALGIPVVALEPKTHADVRRVLGAVGQLLDVPPAEGAERVWRVIDAGVQAAAQSLPAHARGVRVYFEVSRGPYAAGSTSFIGETLSRLGVRNVVPPELGPFPRLNPEFVVRAQPDVLMVGNRSMQPLVMYPGWDGMAAVRTGRICVFDPDDADVVVRPGPRMAEAARTMARCLADKAP